MRMTRANRATRFALLAALAAGLASCSGGGGPGLPPLKVLLFNFAPGFAGVHLNSPLEFTFSAPLDPATVNTDTIRIVTESVTTAQPDPGAPAVGDYLVSGNVVRFLPRIPRFPDVSDAGLRIGFRYRVTVPAAPNVVEPVRTIEGDPNVIEYREIFTTLNHTILPAPGDVTAEPNLNTLPDFFIDEGIENGTDPCDRSTLPVADRDSPQVIDSDPNEGETGFGTITGIEPGLGTAFVRLDPLTLKFSEPIAPWRIRPQNISIRNTNLGGETFDLFFFFRQDRSESILQVTVFDAGSAFDQASVPQGRYVLALTGFSDLAGNPLVNTGTCTADGTFNLSFSTVSSPAQPTDIVNTFQDNDAEGHVDYGGLDTAATDPNLLRDHGQPFVGGLATDIVAVPSPSTVTSSANWGDTALWTGREMTYNNGYDPLDTSINTVPAVLRLRGGSSTAATPIMAPIVGRANGRSDPAGSSGGSQGSPTEPGKIDFVANGSVTVTLFTGDATTGPIFYHYNEFHLEATAGGRPVLTFRSDSIYPLVIFVEDFAVISGDILLDGGNGEFGFNTSNSGTAAARAPGGQGGAPGPGGGRGGNGGSAVLGTGLAEDVNGQTGSVPVNVLGPLDQLSEAVAGISSMVTGGGGHYNANVAEGSPLPVYEGGGGGGHGSAGGQGADYGVSTPGSTDQGVGGKQIGDGSLTDPYALASGGAGGGGGGADDDTPPGASGGSDTPDGLPNFADDGGGGGGGGGGFFSLSCGGDITLGEYSDNATPADTSDDIVRPAIIRCVGGRGGSTFTSETPSGAIGFGEGGGGGAGGAVCLISAAQIKFVTAEILAFGKRGGNSPTFEGSSRTVTDEAGAGGGGLLYFADSNGINPLSELGPDVGGSNSRVIVTPQATQDIRPPIGTADLTGPQQTDRNEMSGSEAIVLDVYGDDPRERLFGQSRIVTEWFDTLSDSVAYNVVRTLSNAGQKDSGLNLLYPAGTIRVFLDAARSNAGLPDLSTEDAQGNIIAPAGASIEVPLTFDAAGAPTVDPQNESRFIVPAGSQTLGKRFARVRILFDLSLIGSPATLLTKFAIPGSPNVQIAPGNSQGNIDTAPSGVPAVADLRVNFTP